MLSFCGVGVDAQGVEHPVAASSSCGWSAVRVVRAAPSPTTGRRNRPVLEDQDPVGQHHRLVHVMGDQQDAGRCRSHSSVTRRCILIRVSASSALNGSSSSSRSGSRTRARASEARCASPPDRVHRPDVRLVLEADLVERVSARRAVVERARARSAARARRCRPTLLHGSSRGSWKATESAPVTRISPAMSRSRSARLRSSVDLPEPLRPSRATNSPRSSSRSRPSSTCVVPKDRWQFSTFATDWLAPLVAVRCGAREPRSVYERHARALLSSSGRGSR